MFVFYFLGDGTKAIAFRVTLLLLSCLFPSDYHLSFLPETYTPKIPQASTQPSGLVLISIFRTSGSLLVSVSGNLAMVAVQLRT